MDRCGPEILGLYRFVFWQQRQHSNRKEINLKSNRNPTTIVADTASAPFLWRASARANCSTPTTASKDPALVAQDLPVVEKGVEEEVTAEPEDGAFAEQACDPQGLSQEEGQTFQQFAKDVLRLESFELKVGFEKCMSQQCHKTVTTLSINQCLFLTVCREWSRVSWRQLTNQAFEVFLETVLVCFGETEGIE